MEAIFLDNAFKNTRIVDAFTSFIWNDYYIGCGDFELRYPMTDGALGGIELERYLTNLESDRYMIVEGIEMKTSVEEGNYVVITGRSLESILDRRIVIANTVLTGKLQDCIFRLLGANILWPTDDKRKISKIVFKWNDDEELDKINIDVSIGKGANLYDAIYDICYAYHVGFRCLPQEDSTIAFELYSGKNRSYAQTKNPWVVFSPKFENIQETDMTLSMEQLRNVIYAEATWTERVLGDNEEYEDVEKSINVEIGEETGMSRREMFISSNTTPERLNKSDFGDPKDRVDVRQFSQYKVVRSHEEELDHDWQVWYNMNAMYGYSNPYPPPHRADYEEWDWVMVDEPGYKTALVEAEKQINIEYEAAKQNAEIITEKMIREEAEMALAEKSVVSSFDGEVAPKFQYLLGKDYELGDVVQIVNEYGFQATTRVVGILYSEEVGIGYMSRPQFESDDKAVFEI